MAPENLPLDEVLLRMVIQFLPNPLQAAPYRMPFLAPGVDKDSELYQSLITSNPDGPLMGMFTKVFVSQKDFLTRLNWPSLLRNITPR